VSKPVALERNNMLFYISPSKTMKLTHMTAEAEGPFLLAKQPAATLRTQLSKLSIDELKAFYKVSDKVAQTAYELLRVKETGAAIDLFEGLVFKNLSYNMLDESDKSYLESHLIIGSALYGLVSPRQQIRPYRLDLDNPITLEEQSLPQYWKKRVTMAMLKQPSKWIIDLASEEYSQLLDLEKLNKGSSHRHNKKGNESLHQNQSYKQVIKIEFKERREGKLVNVATFSKMARGQFLRQAAVMKVASPEDLKTIHVMGFAYDASQSTESIFCYVSNPQK